MINFVKQQFADLAKFLKHPSEKSSINQSTSFKVKTFLLFFVFEIVIINAIGPLMDIVTQWFNVDVGSHKILELLNNSSYLVLFFSVAVFAPLVEEFIFRFPLRYRRNYLLLFFVSIIKLTRLVKPVTLHRFFYKNWHKFYGFVFYLSAILFGAVHLQNFSNWRNLFFILPILVMPQFILGIFLGYLRVKFGIWWAVMLHAIHNFVLVTFAFVLMTGAFPFSKVNYQKYSVEFGQTKSFVNFNDNHCYFTNDSVSMKKMTIKKVFQNVIDKKVLEVKLGSDTHSNCRIDLCFVSRDSSIIAKKAILNALCRKYNLVTKDTTICTNVLSLVVTDTSKLNKSNSDSLDCNYKSSLNTLDLRFTSLKELVKVLDDNYPDVYFQKVIADSTLYNFQIEGSTFEKKRQYLKNVYGIEFISREDSIKAVNIVVNDIE